MSNEKKTYEPIPAGEYAVSLKNFEDVKTKAGTGRYIKAAFQVQGRDENDETGGRLVFHNFNYENASAKAQEIGQDQLNKFIAAASNGQDTLDSLKGNMGRLNDYVEATVIARVKVQEAESYTDANGVPKMSQARNKITSFAAL